MSYSAKLATTLNDTRLRTEQHVSTLSGMCATCSDQCTGLCEIGLSAVRGFEAAYPRGTANRQFGSEKTYPFDYSHFNINGRVFGAQGAEGNPENINAYSAEVACEIGAENKIPLKAPIILPAMAKLNWRDYYSGAAMAGVLVVIGESVIRKDPELAYNAQGKVSHAPLLGEMIDCFRKYDNGFGDIVLQANADDVVLGTPEYVLKTFALKTVEIKFGQAAKGIQHVEPVYDYDVAKKIRKDGYLVSPDPTASHVVAAIEAGEPVRFTQCARLPMWDEAALAEIIARYRTLGAENIFFKMAGYDVTDIERVLRIASANRVALVTFDGAGGGTGNSPCKMMNEWSWPTIELEQIVHSMMSKLEQEGAWLPAIAIGGGLVFEDTVFKALALGAPYVKLAAIGRAAMSAAMAAENVGRQLAQGIIPALYKEVAPTAETVFVEAATLNHRYRHLGEPVPAGSVGLYSYLQRVAGGLQLMMTLNRKFKLSLLDQSDVIPLTGEARAYLDAFGPAMSGDAGQA